jgi:hypothetical protein
LVAASRRNFCAAVKAEGVSPAGWGVVAEVLMDILFLCRPSGAQFLFIAYPPFSARMRSPSGWANLSTLLRRWSADASNGFVTY